MNPQESALVQLAQNLDRAGLPYMVIGGMANAVWGVSRATLDVDATIWTDRDPAELIPVFDGPFRVRPSDPAAFVRQTRVLPLETHEGVRLDLVFGQLPYEQEAIQRAIIRDVSGTPVRFCTAEDLVLMKLVSSRPRDREDVHGILVTRGTTLDLAYLSPRVDELADLLERPEIRDDYRRWLTESRAGQ
jgi:hypothetical protein